MRFLWGLRIALPIALGLTTMPALRYLALDLVSAALWSRVVTLAGFTAGHAVMKFFDDLRNYEIWIVLAVLVIGAAEQYAPKSEKQRKGKSSRYAHVTGNIVQVHPQLQWPVHLRFLKVPAYFLILIMQQYLFYFIVGFIRKIEHRFLARPAKTALVVGRHFVPVFVAGLGDTYNKVWRFHSFGFILRWVLDTIYIKIFLTRFFSQKTTKNECF
jgi:putative Ca2+/H+ antiporter (TMEM165/GDT1 family)